MTEEQKTLISLVEHLHSEGLQQEVCEEFIKFLKTYVNERSEQAFIVEVSDLLIEYANKHFLATVLQAMFRAVGRADPDQSSEEIFQCLQGEDLLRSDLHVALEKDLFEKSPAEWLEIELESILFNPKMLAKTFYSIGAYRTYLFEECMLKLCQTAKSCKPSFVSSLVSTYIDLYDMRVQSLSSSDVVVDNSIIRLVDRQKKSCENMLSLLQGEMPAEIERFLSILRAFRDWFAQCELSQQRIILEIYPEICGSKFDDADDLNYELGKLCLAGKNCNLIINTALLRNRSPFLPMIEKFRYFFDSVDSKTNGYYLHAGLELWGCFQQLRTSFFKPNRASFFRVVRRKPAYICQLNTFQQCCLRVIKRLSHVRYENDTLLQKEKDALYYLAVNCNLSVATMLKMKRDEIVEQKAQFVDRQDIQQLVIRLGVRANEERRQIQEPPSEQLFSCLNI